MYDFWDNNGDQIDSSFTDWDTSGIKDIVTFCVEMNRMMEFHLAATLSDGDTDDHIEYIALVLDDTRQTVLAKSSIVWDTPRGRTYSLYYKGYTYTGDQDYKVIANYSYGGDGSVDSTSIIIPENNLQYAIRIFNEGYVLENDQPNTTCTST